MARRKTKDTEPKLQDSVSNYPEPTVALSEGGFASLIRLVKLGRVAQVRQIQDAAKTNMKRLRLRSKGVEPVDGIPEGSDQVNVGSILDWMRRIRKRDGQAKEQLKVLAATIKRRFA